MKYTCLSVKQPWAAYTIMGEKTIEVRPWRTDYRGDLMICSSRGDFYDKNNICFEGMKALGLVTLKDIRPMEPNDLVGSMTAKDDDIAYIMHCYAWVLENPRPIVPIRMSGRLNLYTLDLEPNFLPSDYPYEDYLMDSQLFAPEAATPDEIAHCNAVTDYKEQRMALDSLIKKYAKYTLSPEGEWIRNPNYTENEGNK